MHRPADVVLRPGGFCFAEEGARISTLLGSCVSITMWHPRLLVGGMCHYVVPSRRRTVAAADLDGRYADEAVRMFLREVQRSATRPEEYEVKMFGGGNQFPDWVAGTALDIPGDNVAAGLQLLAHHGFTLLTRHLGGTGPRQVVFEIATGHVWVRHVELSRSGGAR